MKITRQRWPAHSLLNRGNGIAAEDVRRQLGVSPVGRVRELERRVGELERHLALVHRHFQGVQLADTKTPAVPDEGGWLQMYSPDDTISVQRDPNLKANVIAVKVNPDELDFCEAAITTVIDCNDDSLTATTCSASLDFAPGTYVSFQLTGSANAQILTAYWCAPAASVPVGGVDGDWYTKVGAPAGWLRLAVGNACTGGCTVVRLPYWADGP